jgi:hypothetical protein
MLLDIATFIETAALIAGFCCAILMDDCETEAAEAIPVLADVVVVVDLEVEVEVVEIERTTWTYRESNIRS